MHSSGLFILFPFNVDFNLFEKKIESAAWVVGRGVKHEFMGRIQKQWWINIIDEISACPIADKTYLISQSFRDNLAQRGFAPTHTTPNPDG